MRTYLGRARSCALATTSIVALALAGAVGGVAVAQDEEEEGGATERITITGSRIQRPDFTANSPIVTVESDTFENRSSFNVEAALNQLPQFTPSGTQNLGSPAGTPFAGPQNAPGAATLNLRGLGSNRLLVLVNGRRPQPINAQLVVDVNAIPAAAIDNVEVITGGAAAVYGADAIAGVVNFILRDDFEGFELDGQYGITELGDNQESQLSALIGGNFDDGRGNAMAGLVWSQRGEALQKDRDFYTRGWNDPLTNGASIGNAVPGITQVDIGGVNLGVNFDGTIFNPIDPLGSGANYGPYTGPLHQLENGAGFKIGPNGQLQYNDPAQSVNIPSTRYSIFANAHYDVTDSITAFVEGGFTENYTSALSLVPPAFNVWALSIPYNADNDDPGSPNFGADQTNFHPVPAALADLLNTRTGAPGFDPLTAPWTMTRSLDFLGRLRTDTTTNIYQVTAGLEGELPFRDWTWEVYGSHGKTTVLAYQPEGSISQAFLTTMIAGTSTSGAFQTATGPWGQGWTTGEVLAVNGSCATGIPIFNPDGSVPTQVQVSQDCKDFATLETNNITQLEQNIVEATMQGGLFDIPWSGEIRFALGATYRSEDFHFNPDTGLSGEQDRANVINLIALPLRTEGFIDVAEVFGELLVPILTDQPLVQNLELELGYRYGDYNTAGGVDTYKMLADWTVTDWLRFRGGYQRANRAPNIYELFAPITAAIDFNGPDACANIASTTPPWGNIDVGTGDNAFGTRANVQLACAELIARDGGFNYKTILDDPNPGENPALFPNLDITHMSNFRETVPGYNGFFPFTLALQQGNPDLDNEVADTWTFGTVIRSPFDHPLLSGLTVSVDWYQIEIDGTIDVPSAFTVYQQCLHPDFNSAMTAPAGSLTGAELLAGSPFCALINREPVSPSGEFGAVRSGLARNFDAAYVNLGGTETSGIDVQVNWAADFADMGPLASIPGSVNASVVASFLNEFAESPFPGGEFVDLRGTSEGPGYYRYRTFTTLGYNVGPASIGARVTYLPELLPLDTVNTAEIRSHTQLDLFGRWALSERVDLRAGIDNALDEQPEVTARTLSVSPNGEVSITNNALATTNQNYDVLGRRFFVGATLRY